MNEIELFFEYYGRILSDGDLTGIADCYTAPGLVLGDEDSIAIADLGEVEKSFAGAAERYRAQGLINVRANVISSTALTRNLILVDVRWDYLNANGENVQQTRYHYLLRSTPTGNFKIQVVIAH